MSRLRDFVASPNESYLVRAVNRQPWLPRGMTRRALPAHRVIPVHREIAFNLGREKIAKMGHKNEDISESVCSFDSGSIFLPSLGHEVSRNAFVVSILFPGRIFSIGKDFFMRMKI